MAMKLKAGYRCNLCGLEHFIQVRERAQGEEITNYVHHVANMAGEDHNLFAVLCASRHLDVMVPMSSNGIGFAGEELTKEEIADLTKQCNAADG